MASEKSPDLIPAFAEAQNALLAEELAAEMASTTLLLGSASPVTLARAGLAILNLILSNQRTGLGGKLVLELETDPSIGAGEIGEHGLRVGDIVRVGPQPKGQERKKEKAGLEANGLDGVVTRADRKSLSVASDKDEGGDTMGGRLWVVKLANDVTYKRMNWTMSRLQKMQEREYATLTRVLFGLDSPSLLPSDLEDPERGSGIVDFFDSSLNESQRDAIRFALASRELALIHGPPGTGKTYTLIELILQLLHRKQRVLVCGPSNVSVDNIVERLAPHKVPMVRLGHPARLLPSVLNHSLDVLTRTSAAAELVKDIRNEMDEKQASIKKTRNGRERKAVYGEIKELRKEFRERERKCVSDLVQGSKVVLATLHGSGGSQVRNERFDVVVIDEASQALEAQCWVPLLTARKVVLAGDHLQLPPTIKSLNSKAPAKSKTAPVSDTKGFTLERTMFDRLLELHGSSIKRMLTTQYRMHETIMRFPSDELYEAKLVAAEAVRARLLMDLPYPVNETDDTKEPLVFWDTQGGDFPEENEDEGGRDSGKNDKKKGAASLLGDSKSNTLEAALVKKHIRALVEQGGVRPEDIAVVTPYNAQLARIARLLKGDASDAENPLARVELGSVDGFQGREKEAVVVSLVRSNAEHEVGFLSEKRRLNVAMTRPKRHLCVIGDSETVGKGSPFLKRWMAFLEENADLRYPSPVDLINIE